MSTGKVVLGVLAGAAVGALLGVLFAPGKGSKTRQNILDMGDDYADGIKDKFDEYGKAISRTVEKTKNEVGNFVSNGNAHYDENKKDAKHVLSDLKTGVNDLKSQANKQSGQ